MNPIQSLRLGEYQAGYRERLEVWMKENFTRRLWARDFKLWVESPAPEITNRMGWLELPGLMRGKIDELAGFADEIRAEGLPHAVLLGMGGSSLAPEFFQKTFGNRAGYPELLVMDSTHPAAVVAVERAVDLERTLFIVSSKSGTTLETLSFYRYFWDRVGRRVGNPGSRFVAITDPGTPLAVLARENGFRRLFEASPDVGGRFSALTEFGLVPAALIGMDVGELLRRAEIAAKENGPDVPEDGAPGIGLGAVLGKVGKRRNKLTIWTSPSLRFFPAWLEQLIAESTGKDGKGLIPVVDEPLVAPEKYGSDRLFVGLALERDRDRDIDSRLDAVEKLGHPVVRILLKDLYALGREIFRWEVAVAAASSELGIHPFNQPDVELAKEFARAAMKKGEAGDGEADGEIETVPANDPGRLSTALGGWIRRARSGDYFSVQAFLPSDKDLNQSLVGLELALIEKTGLATTLGYGPRFLHSTGQLHKGGADEGLFLQLVDEPGLDLAVQGTGYSFGELIRAQAVGDYLALMKKGRRVLRVSLGNNRKEGLRQIQAALREAE